MGAREVSRLCCAGKGLNHLNSGSEFLVQLKLLSDSLKAWDLVHLLLKKSLRVSCCVLFLMYFIYMRKCEWYFNPSFLFRTTTT